MQAPQSETRGERPSYVWGNRGKICSREGRSLAGAHAAILTAGRRATTPNPPVASTWPRPESREQHRGNRQDCRPATAQVGERLLGARPALETLTHPRVASGARCSNGPAPYGLKPWASRFLHRDECAVVGGGTAAREPHHRTERESKKEKESVRACAFSSSAEMLSNGARQAVSSCG